MESSHFPILIRFTETDEYAIANTPEDIPHAKGFKVIKTNYWMNSCGGETKIGDKVLFIPHNGSDGEQAYTQSKGLIHLKEYIVENVGVYSWYTDLQIIGYPGIHNSVLFVRIDD